MVAALALSGTLIGGSVALADEVMPMATSSIIVSRGNSVQEGVGKVKENASGSDAVVTIHTNIASNDHLQVYFRNKNDNVVSVQAADFSGTISGMTKTVKYRDGKGKKGNRFFPVFSLTYESYSSNLNIKYVYNP